LLPGELRNKIYDYAMSGITVSVLPSRQSRDGYQLHAHLTGAYAAFLPTSNASDVTALMRVCRQIHAETHLLQFRSITFQIQSDGSFVDFLDALLSAQRDAITTVQMSPPDAYAGGCLWYIVKQSVSNDFESQRNHLDYLEWSFSLALDRLPGLKRVEVEQYTQWTYVEAANHLLREGISSCVKGRDIDIDIQA
jgi:hypothetical protein